jgi:hypothetical protein
LWPKSTAEPEKQEGKNSKILSHSTNVSEIGLARTGCSLPVVLLKKILPF